MTDEVKIAIQTYESPWPRESVDLRYPDPTGWWLLREYRLWRLCRKLRRDIRRARDQLLFSMTMLPTPPGVKPAIGTFTLPKE